MEEGPNPQVETTAAKWNEIKFLVSNIFFPWYD